MPECPELRRTRPHAHSKYVYGPIDLYGRDGDVDVMIEAKARDLALLLYREVLSNQVTRLDDWVVVGGGGRGVVGGNTSYNNDDDDDDSVIVRR
jgi:UV DNA damage endonuclease